MVNYLMKFNKRLAGLCTAIYGVTGSKSEWYWGPDQQEAFETVKKEISNSPVLCTFEINAKHRVSTDANKNALGAVLLQYNEEGAWQPVEYASRKMTETEGRYAMVEKEALATTWACEKFDYYLVGRKFEIETDHKPLIAILGEKDLSKLPVRVQRFKLRLMRYDYDIFHTPGKDMFIADLLSRPNSGAVCDEVSKAVCNKVEAYVNSIVSSSAYGDVKEEQLREEVSKDSDALKCIEYLYSGWPSELDGSSKELIGLYGSREIKSDNGTCYASKEFRNFGEKMGFILTTSSPRYPCTNGLAESAVKIVKGLWEKSQDKDVALSAYRTTPLASGYTPSDLIFGRAIRSNLGFPYESDVDYELFEENEIRCKKKVKKRWDKKYRVSKLDELKPGQMVYVKAPTDLNSDDENTLSDSSEDNCLPFGSYSSKEGNSEVVENANGLSESQENMIPDLAILEQGEETPGVAEHVEETPGVSEHEGETSVVERNSRSEFVPLSREPVVTSSGRVSKPPKKYGMEYYK
ncbi:uncharacterized protein [Watersipora subatra]|uniref:uncharacterized protein n=1 Tax=Watersipora subatra TaxID=2589382 RepID=UPI00355BAD17